MMMRSGDVVGCAPRWPAIEAEERPWVPGIPAGAVPRAVRARHAGPYRATVVPAIADAQVGLPSDVAALEAEATAEIARFDTEVGAEHVPPHADAVPGLMADLVRFVRRTDLPLLAQAALARAQFETIHPFADGNGRTGRALVHAMLRAGRLTRRVTVPVPAGLLTDTRAYFDTLTAYRAGDPVPIVAVLATASAAIADARQLVAELHEVRRGWEDTVRARRGATTWRLADLLLGQPVVVAATVARELGVSPANALCPIRPLVEAGVLTEVTGAARNRMWQSPEVLAALDAFAVRAGRRSLG